MGEIKVKRISKNWQVLIPSEIEKKWKSIVFTILVICPIISVLIFNFTLAQVIEIPGWLLQFEKSASKDETAAPKVLGVDSEKYSAIVNAPDFEKNKQSAIKFAQSKFVFNYKNSEKLSSEDQAYLENLTYESYAYTKALLGEERNPNSLPITFNFYSSDYLPSFATCSQLGGKWSPSNSQCLKTGSREILTTPENWNGNHINRFNFYFEGGKKYIANFESFEINIALGQDDEKIGDQRQYMDFSKSASGNDICEKNRVQDTIIHELVHNFNSIIKPVEADEALAYYAPIAITRIILADNLKSLGKSSSGEDNVEIAENIADRTSCIEQIVALDKQFAKSNGNKIKIADSGIGLDGFEISRALNAYNEYSNDDLAACIFKDYKQQVPVAKSLQIDYNIDEQIKNCVGAESLDKIQKEENSGSGAELALFKK